MRVAVLQSNYLPWKGYFDLIGSVDKFIFYDDNQFTKNDWRNRNKIKTDKGVEWISIPCGTDLKRLICEVQPSNNTWQKQHWLNIKQHYSKTPYFKDYKDFFEDFYLNHTWTNLSEINHYLIKHICRNIFKFKTIFEDSRQYHTEGKRADKLFDLLKKANTNTYLSGPAAKDYLKEEDFINLNIKLEWMDYSGYKEYNQTYPPFEHFVSVIDLIFNTGPDAINYLKCNNRN